MRQVFNLLLVIFLAQLIACGEKDVDTVSRNPDQEEIPDPSREPQDTLSDIFEIECANHSPQLYLSVIDKDANPILDCDYDETGTPKEGYIAIRKVNYTESDTSNTFTLAYNTDNSVISIYPETIHYFLDQFEETGDSIRFYGKRPVSSVADSVVIPVKELWLPIVVEWTNNDVDTFALRYRNTCDIQLTQVCLHGDSIGYNSATLIKSPVR
ncbi:MAG: WG repeat-containing protein [Parabacteroides sp.]|nr:WG repeat-containing protein [Parabacteroides sp.]